MEANPKRSGPADDCWSATESGRRTPFLFLAARVLRLQAATHCWRRRSACERKGTRAAPFHRVRPRRMGSLNSERGGGDGSGLPQAAPWAYGTRGIGAASMHLQVHVRRTTLRGRTALYRSYFATRGVHWVGKRRALTWTWGTAGAARGCIFLVFVALSSAGR